MLLDVRLIRERRTALGLSRAALAKRVARSRRVVDLLEQGDNHPRLTLDFVRSLASALGVQPVDLVNSPKSAAAPLADDIKVEAALSTSGKGLTAADLSRAFKWRLDRVHAALEQLRARLAPTGVVVHQQAGKWHLRGRVAVLSETEHRRLEGSRVARARLSRYDAEVLRAVVAGQADGEWVRTASNSRNVSLSRLLKLGYIEPQGAGFRASTGVEFGLGIATTDPKSPEHQERVGRSRSTRCQANDPEGEDKCTSSTR